MYSLNERIQKTIISELKSLRCTASLSGEAQRLLASTGVKREYALNDYVWKIGEPGEYIAIIVSGLVEISRHSGGDDEMTMGIFGPSDVIGISAVMKKSTYPGNAKSLTKDCEVIKLYLRPILSGPGPDVQELQTWVRETMLLHEQVLRDKIDILNAGNVENRIYELLKHLLRRFGVHESQSRHFIPLRITRAQAAKMINVRVETMIRMLSKWQRQKFIRWTQKGILIENLPLLEKNLSSKQGLK